MRGGHVVLLDLDGTLIDSAPGIVEGMRIAFAAVDAPVPDEALMRSWIGPPVRETLVRELAAQGDDAVERANAAFREYFDSVGAHESVVFEGVPDALAQIAQAGAVMSVVTHKPAALAQLALEQHELGGYIVTLHAPPAPGVAVPKTELFREALGATRPMSVISVGDRGSDIRAAAACGIAGVGVAWGYGSTRELQEAGALRVVGSPSDLPGEVGAPRPA